MTNTKSPQHRQYSTFHSEAFYQSNCLQFKRHENLCSRGRGLWRIQQGYVRSITWSSEGDPVPLGFWQTGDIVGYAISSAQHYEVRCLTAVTAEYLGRAHSLSPDVALAQIQQSNDLLRIAHCRQAEKRLLSFLCWLAQRFGESVAEGHQIQPRLTHQEIADSIGSTRVTVTRLLKELARTHKIKWNTHEKIVYARTFEQSFEHTCY
ncbi:MAG: Crp/Fnr family transcriptional regulator [Cyanobacteria bacterium J06626_6]